MRLPPHTSGSLRRQRGAIALVFGLTLVLLLAAAGLVIDLGHLYVLKSELQNGADSAALAGAKEIDLTAAGIGKAAARALLLAQQNKYDFSSALTLDNSNISFSASPAGPWATVSEAQASPASKTFIRVDTGSKTVPTYLMGAAGVTTVATNGVAVAGRFVVDITPLGVCGKAPATRLGMKLAGLGEQELLEFGFRRGVTYDLLKMGPIAGPADPMLLNAVDSPPTACAPNHSSAAFTAPFVCEGNSTVASTATVVYANTGLSTGPVEAALNSRFNNYAGASPCLPATAPPDRNVRPYAIGDAAFGPDRWMEPNPATQENTATSSGALWSYSRPLHATGSAGAYVAGAPFATTDWPSLYGVPAPVAAEYPAGLAGSPYAETAAPYFLAPATNTPTVNRRLLNLAIVDCSAATSNAMSCKALPIVGVGRFFLQRPANLNGVNKGLYVEFAGLIEPVPNSEIKLYR